MAAITDYTTLVVAVQDLSEDDGVEFAAYIPTALDLAEERLFKELDLPDLEVKATGTLTQNSNLLNKPSGYKFANYLMITVSGRYKTLKKRLETYINDYWPDITVTSIPTYYCDASQTQFKLAPTPDSNYTYEIKYSKQPVKLAVNNTTNYFTTNCSMLLYYATLIEMAKFMKAWGQISIWENTYETFKNDWNVTMGRVRRDDTETPHNPDTGPNSIKHIQNSSS